MIKDKDPPIDSTLVKSIEDSTLSPSYLENLNVVSYVIPDTCTNLRRAHLTAVFSTPFQALSIAFALRIGIYPAVHDTVYR